VGEEGRGLGYAAVMKTENENGDRVESVRIVVRHCHCFGWWISFGGGASVKGQD
jgi:hypothetical protein